MEDYACGKINRIAFLLPSRAEQACRQPHGFGVQPRDLAASVRNQFPAERRFRETPVENRGVAALLSDHLDEFPVCRAVGQFSFGLRIRGSAAFACERKKLFG
jgi:hypothetical protein